MFLLVSVYRCTFTLEGDLLCCLSFFCQVSVSCGIPDFRSKDGIYARLAVDFPDLPDPQAMFDIEYFKRDPRPFFKFAKVCIEYIFLISFLLDFKLMQLFPLYCRKSILGSFGHHFVIDLLLCWIKKRSFSGTTLRTLTLWSRLQESKMLCSVMVC